jgi:hypothetical protein
MWNRAVKLGLVVLLAGSGLALGEFRPKPDHELDDYSDSQLGEYLNAELDDIEVGDGGQLEPDEDYSLPELQGAILEALHDDGDDGDEDNIDFADLEEEMDEAGTTLPACIHNALVLADELSLREGSGSYTFQNAGFSLIAQSRKPNGFATTSVAIARAIPAMIADIDRVRKKRGG